MNTYFRPVFALAMCVFLLAGTAQANQNEKMIIALKTDQFELTETDISDLAIGEAQTISTDSGKVLDILRTVDGVEIYVDGALLDINMDEEGVHENHKVRKHVEVICDGDEQCDENVFIHSADDSDVSGWVTEGGNNIIIHKQIELSCSNEEEAGACSDKLVLKSDGEDINLEELHQMHENGEQHKVIVIKKKTVAED